MKAEKDELPVVAWEWRTESGLHRELVRIDPEKDGQARHCRALGWVPHALTDHATATSKLAELQREVERMQEALRRILWHRKPGGAPTKYEYQVECIAASALGKFAFKEDAAIDRSLSGGEG